MVKISHDHLFVSTVASMQTRPYSPHIFPLSYHSARWAINELQNTCHLRSKTDEDDL